LGNTLIICLTFVTLIMKFISPLLLFCFIAIYFSCTKPQPYYQEKIVGEWKWKIQYANNPNYNSTPQSTGINEQIIFSNFNTYQLIQNNNLINSGAYKIGKTKNPAGINISTVYFSNSRVQDSIAYFDIPNDTTLFFSNDLFGTVGSGARYYIK
jgi:hypothetical protein